jgi:hypothetical protein
LIESIEGFGNSAEKMVGPAPRCPIGHPKRDGALMQRGDPPYAERRIRANMLMPLTRLMVKCTRTARATLRFHHTA